MDELQHYEYELPQELIAPQPLSERDASRLMVVARNTGEFAHRHVRDLPIVLRAGDLLVLNDTKVIPARLFGRRIATGGKWEGLFLSCTETGNWKLIGHSRGRLVPGETIAIHPAHTNARDPEELRIVLEHCDVGGVWTVRPRTEEDAFSVLQRYGTVPLPPYLHRPLATGEDWQRYQTVYARRAGAIAAPTAGLHFTPELLRECRARDIATAFVTLHVGLGTFRPVTAATLSEHRMHSEWCEVTPNTAAEIMSVKNSAGRIVAVGTTTVRTLEAAAQSGFLRPWCGETDLFIRPPYQFRVVDALLTNFHLPRSTLLALVCAFGGTSLVQRAYQAAIAERYRFFSYGDAMLLS